MTSGSDRGSPGAPTTAESGGPRRGGGCRLRYQLTLDRAQASACAEALELLVSVVGEGRLEETAFLLYGPRRRRGWHQADPLLRQAKRILVGLSMLEGRDIRRPDVPTAAKLASEFGG